MPIELSVPTTYVKSKHCIALFELWSTIAQYLTRSEITLHFRDCKFLSHNGVAFLGGVDQWVKARGGQITFQWDTLQSQIRNNLAQNGFLHSMGIEQHPWNGNSIPYRIDLNRDRNGIMDYLLNRWLGKGWVNISPKLQREIAGRVWEIYENAFTHSQSEVGIFSCGQHYPTQKELHLTIVDFGVGIPSKVRSLPQNSSLSTSQALEWAFSPGNTTAVGISRGMGLTLLQEFIHKNQGDIKIFSNDGYACTRRDTIEYKTQNINFSGTFVNISLRCNESYYCLASEVPTNQEPLF